MRQNDQQLGQPMRAYQDTKANIVALGLGAGDEGCVAYANDIDRLGTFSGAAWTWRATPPAVAGYALVSDGVDTWAADQTPAWTGRHSFAAGIAFVGASDANEVTVPDNIAIALELLDAGGLEYMRIISTDAGPSVVFNEGGVDVDFRVEGVGQANALFVQGSDGKVGVGTATVPHGGVGYAKFAFEGTNASAAGPHVQFTTAADDYPLYQILPWQHDNIVLNFDAYYDGADKSSDAGSNARIQKAGDKLVFKYDSGVAQGAAVTWNEALVLDLTNGDLGIGVTPAYRLDVEDDVSGFMSQFFNDGDNADRHVIKLQGGADNGAAVGTTHFIYCSDGNGDATGTIKTVDGVFTMADLSDERRKVNIIDTKLNGLGIINGLRVRDYNWKANPDGPVMTSFVAQEAQKVFPTMIGEALDGTLMTARAMLIPILAKAVQELNARLAQVERRGK